MPPRRRRHPKYKAYSAHQLQRMKEKFPFLSSQQIKAKISSTWDSLSPEKQNDWGDLPKAKLENIKGDSFQSSEESEVSSLRSPPSHKTKPHTYKKSPPPKGSPKIVRFTPSIPDTLTLPETSTRSSQDNSQIPPPSPDMWAMFQEYDCISEHELVVEEKGESDDSITSEENNMLDKRPFADNIWKEFFEKPSLDNKEQPLCNLFQKREPKYEKFGAGRYLTSLSPTDGNTSRDMFKDNDEEIFA